jgi:hypothetical protein
MFAEEFHSMVKGIHLALEMKTSFGNSMPVTGFSTESSTLKPGHPTYNRQWLHRKREKRRNMHTNSYKAKLE